MIRLFVALRTKIVVAVGAAHAALSHVFCGLLAQKVAFVVFLLVIDCRRRHLEGIAATALDHTLLSC